jgi:hypothetical protein
VVKVNLVAHNIRLELYGWLGFEGIVGGSISKETLTIEVNIPLPTTQAISLSYGI